MQLELIRGTTVTSLSDGQPFSWLEEDGTGLAPLHWLGERGPNQHGATLTDFRLDPRLFVLAFLFNPKPGDQAAHHSARDTLTALLRPARRPLALRFQRADGGRRQIDCVVNGGVAFPTKERVGMSQRVVVEFQAADPTFYDPERQFVSVGITVTGSVFGFPQGLPWGFGENATIDTTRTIAYPGTWQDHPEIEIVGPLSSPTITNLTTGDTLSLPGVSIPAGVSYVIDCRPGRTSVRSGDTNKLAELSDDSDLESFHLAADPDAALGLNDIRVTGSAATIQTQIYLRYVHRFIGL